MTQVSFPQGARVGFISIGPWITPAWHDEYRQLAARIQTELGITFPSLDRVACWRTATDHVLMRNTYADAGVSLGYGEAAIWMAIRNDREFRLRSTWRDLKPAAERWLNDVAPRLEGALARLGCMAAESQHQLRLAA